MAPAANAPAFESHGKKLPPNTRALDPKDASGNDKPRGAEHTASGERTSRPDNPPLELLRFPKKPWAARV